MRSNQQGYTLIELLIVIAIIGILAAMLIPNLLDALDRSKQRATVGELHYWGLAVSAYHAEKGQFPPQDVGNGYIVTNVAPFVVPYTISVLRTTDHWNNSLFYYTDGTDSYTVTSYGKDGQVGFDCTSLSWNDYRCDIRLVDGIFIASP